jgi:hypothetical protein
MKRHLRWRVRCWLHAPLAPFDDHVGYRLEYVLMVKIT